MLQDLSEFKFIGLTKLLYNISKSKCHAPGKMYREFPDLFVFTQVLKEKIIEAVLDYILDHVVPSILCKKTGVACQVAARKRFFVNIF